MNWIGLKMRPTQTGDRKNTPGDALGEFTTYSIYRNALGQLILDPVKAVPASEMWLYENAEALASVKRGLRESAEGKTVYRGGKSSSEVVEHSAEWLRGGRRVKKVVDTRFGYDTDMVKTHDEVQKENQ